MSTAEMLPIIPLRSRRSAGMRPAYASVVPASDSTTVSARPRCAMRRRAMVTFVGSISTRVPATRARSCGTAAVARGSLVPARCDRQVRTAIPAAAGSRGRPADLPLGWAVEPVALKSSANGPGARLDLGHGQHFRGTHPTLRRLVEGEPAAEGDRSVLDGVVR